MSVGKAISSNVVTNNSSTVLFGGSVTDVNTFNIGYGETNMDSDVPGVTEVILGITDEVNGVNLPSFLASTGIEERQDINASVGQNIYGLATYNFVTGVFSYDGNQGDFVPNWGIDSKTGREADVASNPSYAVPGKFTYFAESVAVTGNYSAKTL